jgi:steroid delta-isomerase-like uncharacterized protein
MTKDTVADHERAVARFYDDIWNLLDLSVIPELLAPNLTFRGSLGDVRTGHAEFADYVKSVTGALDHYRCDIEALVAQEGRAAARMMFSGVHRATFRGIPATGRRISWAGAAFFTFDGDLISDLWVLGDLEALDQQLA